MGGNRERERGGGDREGEGHRERKGGGGDNESEREGGKGERE